MLEPWPRQQDMGKGPDKPPAKAASPEEAAYGSAAAATAAEKLQSLGCLVYPPHCPHGPTDWSLLAGYEEQKRAIEDCVLLALREPGVYDGVAQATRETFETNRPRGILFEGPPGCGKTTTARIVAQQTNVPLIYVPIESFQSKWYGEAEKNLAEIFRLAEEVGKPSDGSILFLDELDSLATARDHNMHEATRRVLGVLLRSLDGFSRGRYQVIGATNRKQDLDLALRSRFTASVLFDLPDEPTRQLIIAKYAKQLSAEGRQKVAGVTAGASGRDLKAICEQAERRWASQIIRGKAPPGSTPPVDVYVAAAEERKDALMDPPTSDSYHVSVLHT
eukprot:jgi/Botrbrau1/4892/Bobra.118_1s0006.1